jgi:3-deoxy-7-phosphoheptulonate synthase
MRKNLDHAETVQEILPSPQSLKAQLPLGEETTKFIGASRHQIRAIMDGEDSRLLIVIGPCSIHEADGALDYARRLKKLTDQHAEKLFIAMRVYFEKPRTTLGWKGFIHDPDLDGSFNIQKGLRQGRELLLKINGLGIPVATEFLDPLTAQYLGDLISWAAIGARTTESQTHREMASGFPMPVGFKNGTSGNTKIALDAV